MPNKYVDFVPDEVFLECVAWVCGGYPANPEKIDVDEFHKNTIDPFKLVFDLVSMNTSVEEWIKTENVRQHDKTINNKVGEFHQKLLGSVAGWEDLKVGDETGVDIRKSDNSIFIELKNKYNTMNDGATENCFRRLNAAVKMYPKAKAYWAYIISVNGKSGEEVWVRGGRSNPQVRKVWGSKVYELVTGDKNALENVWKALPKAINDLRRSKVKVDEQKVKFFFDAAFRG